MAATDALPIPRKGVAYRVIFDVRKGDGTLVTSGTGADSEVSKDQGTFADCTNEATEIATNSGIYYLDLTSTEMNADNVTIKVTLTNSGALPQVISLYPEETGDIRVNITAVLSSAIASINEFKADVSGVPAAVWASGTRTLTSFGTLVADIVAAIDLSGIPAAVWNYLVSSWGAVTTAGGYILSKLGLITQGAVTYTAPVEPDTGNLTLYDQDLTAASGITRPTWSSDDWTAFDLSNAASITLTYRTKGSTTDTAFGTMEAVSDTEIRLATLTKAEAQVLPYGKEAAGIKIVAVLDAAHGDDTVVLVNAALNHFNYKKVAQS